MNSNVFKRRSIRKYKDQILTDEQIHLLLKAGMNAPSARNMQPWHFVVIDDRTILEQLSEIAPGAKLLNGVNQAILICGDSQNSSSGLYWTVDCSAAVMNILLMATDLNIGTCWIGVYPIEERVKKVQKILNLPNGIMAHSIISIGISDEEKEANNRFIVEKVHFNKW